jgi:hypothetical protein
MSDGGYPVIGAGDTQESPLPAGYGSLDAGFPSAEQETLERRREVRGNGGPPRREDPQVIPSRPWARRSREVDPAAPLDGPAPAAPTREAPPPARPARREPPQTARYADADIVEGPVRGTRRPHQKVRVVRGVRSKRLVRRIDVWTVFKVSLVFYLLALVALVVAGVIVWDVASAFGFIHSIEKSIRTLFSLKTFTLHPASTLKYGTAIGALLCLVGVLVNTLVAVTYNLISDLVGGIQVVVVTESD